ncbi:MAG TPA: hypothetical protein DCS35_07560 [Vibrio sp.]|nr:hypothetical protein [Vibrio sp.]
MVVAVGALLIAFCSLLSSCNSNQIAKEALQLSERIETGNQSLVLLAQFDYKYEDIQVVPVNENIHLLDAKIYYPEFFDGTPADIRPPKFSVSISYFKQRLFDYFEKHRKQNTIEIFEGCTPVIVEASYVYNGETFNSRAKYELGYQLTLDSIEPQFNDSIYYRGLKFVGFDVDTIDAFQGWESTVTNCHTRK